MRKIILAFALALSTSTASAQLLDGHTLQYQYLLFTSTTPYDDGAAGNYVIGSGVEVSTFLFDIDVQSNGFTVEFKIADHWTDVPFNGFRLTDVNDTLPSFTSFSMGANNGLLTEIFGPITLTFDADNLYVNWQGTGFQPGTTEFLVNAVAPIPEPETYAMLLAGLGLLGFTVRRRIRKDAATAC